GIRDFHVTGVQTCALPISFKMPQSFDSFTRATGIIIASEGYANWRRHIDDAKSGMADPIRARFSGGKTISAADYLDVIREREKRSEERRVGKECRSRG